MIQYKCHLIFRDIMKKKPNINDLLGATFTVSPMDHSELTRFIPIIHPKQAAVLAIPKIQTKYALDKKSKLEKRRLINIGMSFDHSFLDATQANDFLCTLIEQMDIVSSSLLSEGE